MSYEALRQFADSWGLLFMALLFIGFVLWAFRPSARRHYQDAANLIFEPEDRHG
jgi:cytochrome c oxidase cbb3-type subunit 4